MLETFLAEVLDFDRKEAHREACELEHAVSDTVLEKLYDFMGNPVLPDGHLINIDRSNLRREEGFIPPTKLKREVQALLPG